MSAKLYVFHEYDNGPVKYETFSTLLTSNMSSDTAQTVINWARNNFIGSITQNDYGYTRIEEKKSLNEMIAEL